MPIARITGRGLAAIAISVAFLWACFIGERLTVRDAIAQRAQLMRELRQMRRDHNAQPVSTPQPVHSHSPHVTLS